jgi:hypothetical protein
MLKVIKGHVPTTRAGRRRFEYCAWKPEEVEILMCMRRNGAPILEMAEKLQRSYSSIR